MSDYTFMKSGFGNDNLPKLDDGIIAMITLFSDDSLCVAETYSIHSGRNEISPLDLKKALKVRARYGKQFWSLPGVKERLEIISKKLKDSDTTETMEEDIHNASAITVDTRSTTADCCAGILLNETNTASTEPSQKSREVATIPSQEHSSCICNICNIMNNISQEWPLWEPSIDFEKIIKKAIDSI